MSVCVGPAVSPSTYFNLKSSEVLEGIGGDAPHSFFLLQPRAILLPSHLSYYLIHLIKQFTVTDEIRIILCLRLLILVMHIEERLTILDGELRYCRARPKYFPVLMLTH
jgi:hypothetical protein